MQMYTHYLSFYSAKSLCTGKTFDLSFSRINGYGQRDVGGDKTIMKGKSVPTRKKYDNVYKMQGTASIHQVSIFSYYIVS